VPPLVVPPLMVPAVPEPALPPLLEPPPRPDEPPSPEESSPAQPTNAAAANKENTASFIELFMGDSLDGRVDQLQRAIQHTLALGDHDDLTPTRDAECKSSEQR
jgi:hypothetical protein